MNSIKFKQCFALFLLFSFALPVPASWYQVEVIVFRYLQPDVDGEILDYQPGFAFYQDAVDIFPDMDELLPESEGEGEVEVGQLPQVDATVDIDNPVQEPEPDKDEEAEFVLLSEEKHRLEGVYRVLKLSRDYRPLMHVSWQQPALESSESKAVKLSLLEETESLADQLPAELLDVQLLDELEEPGEPIFEGFVRVRSSLFLHVDIDINYFSDLPVQQETELKGSLDSVELIEETALNEHDLIFSEQQVNHVRLSESRKIKLNEMHYFDHPLFGVIVQVSRIEVDAEAEQVRSP